MGKGGVKSDSQALDLRHGAPWGEWREEQVRQGEDASKVLFCMQLPVLTSIGHIWRVWEGSLEH